MRKKILWIVVSGLMVLSLAMAACATSGSTTSTTPTTLTTQAPQGAVKPAWTGTPPVYGGTMNLASTADPVRWDPSTAQAIMCAHLQYDSNELLGGDWTKGPQGTGETAWEFGFLGDVTLEAGELAESWEFPDDTTIIYHLHQGVHFQNRAPANGRELTADDVVWNMQMQFNYPGLWQTTAYPPANPAKVTGSILPGGDPRRPTSITALDKYTVQVKVPAASLALMFLEIGDNAYTNPPECWTGPNAPGMDTWQKCVGSGQYMCTNFVPGSVLVYTKNPDYFETDPLYPGNQWPYIQTINIMNIPDTSTREAAFRTGKVDMLTVSSDDGKQLLQQCPQLQYVKAVLTRNVVTGRMDKSNLPFQDIRVRQALNLAVDKQSILTGYYKGEAVMLGYPYPPTSHGPSFTPRSTTCRRRRNTPAHSAPSRICSAITSTRQRTS